VVSCGGGTEVGDFKVALHGEALVNTLAGVDFAPARVRWEGWAWDGTGATWWEGKRGLMLLTLKAGWEILSLTGKVAGLRAALVLFERGIPIPVCEFPSPGSPTGNERAPDQF